MSVGRDPSSYAKICFAWIPLQAARPKRATSSLRHERESRRPAHAMTKIDNLQSRTSGVDVNWESLNQLRNIAALPGSSQATSL
jgi:hypothetical protein